MRRRVWLASLLGALVALFVLAVVAPTQAWAESKSVGYNDGSWNGSACEWTWKTVNAEILDDIDSSHYTLNSGWYVMTGDWGDGDRPTVSGTVNIIMEDGCDVHLRDGIHVPPGATLNIYGQSGNSGKFKVGRSKADTAAIGGDSKESSGTVNIYGGDINVTGGSHTNHGGAGIGGGWQGNGTVRIYGGTVKAAGGNEGAGIGGGSNKEGNDGTGGGSNDIKIYGGVVNASGWYGAGIGGGEYGKGGSIQIYGGDVTAVGGADAAGIGGGEERDGGNIAISGGTVKATGGSVTSKGGAGIGGGGKGGSGTIAISGGTVSALGGAFASGIGGGDEGEGNGITISGGNVTATANTQSSNGGGGAAGIGGGDKAAGKNITISGGTVSATGGTKLSVLGGAGIGGGSKGNGENITISGSANITKAQGAVDAAGIGGGDQGEGKNIKITGGTVKAQGGSDKDGGGAGIGGGQKKDGNVEISGGNVTATGGGDGAGIGGGEDGSANVLISGGTVTANGGRYGAGIGGGQDGAGGTITLTGGTIKPTGGDEAAGIGGGQDAESAGTIVIKGDAWVRANGGKGGAGIGGGRTGGRSGTILIEGNAHVTTDGWGGGAGIGSGEWTTGHTDAYYSGQVGITIQGNPWVKAWGGYGGAGIGGGETGPSGPIVINGGTIITIGGNNGGPGIGSGAGCYHTATTFYTVNVTINGGDIVARAGDMLESNVKNAEPGAAIGTGGIEHAANAVNMTYESYFTGNIYLNGGSIKAYSADLTKRQGIKEEHRNVIGTTSSENRDWEKGVVHFSGATVDMYPGPGSGGAIKQMVRASETDEGGIHLEEKETQFQRVTFTTHNDADDTVHEAKLDYRTLVLTGAEEIEEYGDTKLLHNKYKHIRVEPAHKHSFTYTTATTNEPGDTIIATCKGGEGCDLDNPTDNKQAKLILSKPPHTMYDDGKDAGVIVTDEHHIGDAEVAYYLANPDGSRASAVDPEQLYEIPTAPGHYWAELTLSGEDEESAGAGTNTATAHVVYTVDKAKPSLVDNAVIDEGNTAKTIDLSANVKNAGDVVTYALEDPDGSLAAKGFVVEGSILKIPAASATAANPDSVVVHVVSSADENHDPLDGQIVVTINKKPRPTITPDEVTYTYGETGKGVDAQATGDGTHETGAISYAAKSTVDEFATDTGGAGGTTGADGEWSENDIIKVNKTTGILEAKELGTTYVTVTVAGTDFYAPTVKDVKVTVTGAPLAGVSVQGFEGVYDGATHGLSVTVPEGATAYLSSMELTSDNYMIDGTPATDESAAELFKYRDAGTYTVYYFVTAPHYEPVVGSAAVTISKKPINASAYVEGKSYDGMTDATVNVSVNSSDLVEGDEVEVAGVTGFFTNKDAGEDKPVAIDASKATFFGEGAENYEVTIPASATATIEKAWALVMADDLYVPMGSPFPELTATVNAPVLWEDIEYDLACDANMDSPGTYEIVATADPTKGANVNYEIVCTNGTLTVTRPIEVTATGFNGPFDNEFHGITVDVKNPGIPPLDPSVIDKLTHEDWLGLALWAQYAGLDVTVPEDDWTDGEWAMWIEWAKSELKTAVENFKLAEVYYGTEELTAENYKDKGTSISPTFKDASTNTVYYYVVSFDGQTQAGSQDVVINKADPTVTAPTPVANLRYTGNPQTLIAAGSAVGGTMEYSLDGVNWSGDLPSKTEVGSYAVLYRVTGDANHNDVAPTPVIGTIAKALEPGVVLEDWTYGSPAKTPVFSDGENPITTGVTYSYKVKGADDSTYSSEQPTQAGDYTVRAVVQASGTGYDGTYTSDFSVARKPITATVIAADKDYDGTTTATLVAYVEDEDVLAGDSVTIGVVSGSFADANAGDVKQVNVDQGSAVVSGRGSQNYDVTLPETTVGTINKVWAAVWADDVTIQIGQSVPEPFTAHAYTPVKGDELVYTLSCDYEQKVGEYEIVVDLDESVVPNCNYDVAVIPGKLTITKAELTVVAESYAGTYDGRAHGITVDVLPTTASAKVYYSAESDLTPETAPIAGTLVNPTFTDAGSRRVYYCVIADDYSPVIGFKDVVIAKADPAVTAPAPAHLSYTGGPQALVTPGSAQGGTMEYSLDGISWSTDVPVATASGAYAVLYRVTGDANHADVTARAVAATIGQGGSAGVEMYRMYNPYSGEHFYTASSTERDHLVSVGWNYEGVGWIAPRDGAPVYRLYNPYGGDHHYTTSAHERDMLVTVGWNYEGVGWRSAGEDGVPLWRQYNPYASTGSHNYTTSSQERDMLVSIGWRDEGIGWYGLRG